MLIVNSMKGCKCIGTVIPKLAATQNHLEELGKTDSTAESYEDDSLECVYLTSFPDAAS